MFLASPITFPNLGIEIDPSPVAFTVFGKDIYWYGIIIAAGFLLAVFYMLARAKDFGITQDDVLDMILWTVPIGVICARLYYCIFYWELYADDPISILYIWEGGLAIYGGIIGGAITLLVVAKRKKIPAPVLLDVAGMGVIIGQLMGRWGNFMNREAHGAVTDTFLKMGLQDASGVVTYYHPTFLYESVWNLIGFIGLHFFSKKRKFDGEVFLAYVAWYASAASGSRGCAPTVCTCSLPASASASSWRQSPSLPRRESSRGCSSKRSPRANRSTSTANAKNRRRTKSRPIKRKFTK